MNFFVTSIWICTVISMSYADFCNESNFKVTDGIANSDDIHMASNNALYFETSFPEDSELGRLYVVEWKEGNLIVPEISITEPFISSTPNVGDMTIEVNLTEPILGIVDYDQDDRVEQFDIQIDFWSFGNFPIEKDIVSCTFFIIHVIGDVNTQAPVTENHIYDISIYEEYPTQIPIVGVEVYAYDMDSTQPNSEFTATFNLKCPLELTTDSVTCDEGNPELLAIVLSRNLDYEQEEDRRIYCSLVLEDNGSPSLSSTTLIQISTDPAADEDPVFTEDFYKGVLSESEKDSVVKIEPPIEAYDPDTPPTSITYTMESADDQIEGDDYFCINSSTGQVSVAKDIDDEFLLNSIIYFTVMARDEDDQSSTVLLFIELPEIVTSTDSTESQTSTTTSMFSVSSISTETISTSVTTFPTIMPDIQFDQDNYNFQTLVGDADVGTIHADSSETLEYYWDDDPNDYFTLAKDSGLITTKVLNAPPANQYELLANCKIKGSSVIADQTTITITVYNSISTPTFNKSVVYGSIKENTIATEIITVNAEGAGSYCLESTNPRSLEEYVIVDKETGVISTTEPLDADIYETPPQLKVLAEASNTNCLPTSEFNPYLMRNEIIIVLKVENINDNDPVFTDVSGSELTELIIAHPTDRMLQETVRTVTRLTAKDPDLSSLITFSLNDTSHFIIDDMNGDIVCLEGCMEACTPFGCILEATVSDGENTDEIPVTILQLSVDNVYSLVALSIQPEDLDDILYAISEEIGSQIHQLYYDVSTNVPVTKDFSSLFDVHIYALNDTQFLTLGELNLLLEANGYDNAEVFTQRSLYVIDVITTPEDNDKNVLVIVLCVLSVVFCIVVALIAYNYSKKYKIKEKEDKKPITTLTSVYTAEALSNSCASESSNVTATSVSNSVSSSNEGEFNLNVQQDAIDDDNMSEEVLPSATNPNVDIEGINKGYEDDITCHLVELPQPTSNRNVSVTDSDCSTPPEFRKEIKSSDSSEVDSKSVSFKVLVDARIIHNDPLEGRSLADSSHL